jgi:drug/metabolite transporter (DMT)-like permease
MPALLVLAGVMTLCAVLLVLLFPALRTPRAFERAGARLPSVILLAAVGIGLIGVGWYCWWATLSP